MKNPQVISPTIVAARWDEPFVQFCICTHHGIASLDELHFEFCVAFFNFWVLCFFVIALHDRLNLLLSLCLGLPFFFPFVAEHFKVFVVSPCGCLYATRAALLGTV